MRKTKEIDVWVANYVDSSNFEGTDVVIDDGDVSGDFMEMDGVDYNRAKLIIDIPEKKVEITESQFEEMYYKHFGTIDSAIFLDLKKDLGL
jgi:hypothetical protein